MPAITSLASAIRRLRGNESAAHFARRVGVHVRTVYKLESGEVQWARPATLQRIAIACDVDPGWLLAAAVKGSQAA